MQIGQRSRLHQLDNPIRRSNRLRRFWWRNKLDRAYSLRCRYIPNKILGSLHLYQSEHSNLPGSDEFLSRLMHLLSSLLPHLVFILDLSHWITTLLVTSCSIMHHLQLIILVLLYDCIRILVIIHFKVAILEERSSRCTTQRSTQVLLQPINFVSIQVTFLFILRGIIVKSFPSPSPTNDCCAE